MNAVVNAVGAPPSMHRLRDTIALAAELKAFAIDRIPVLLRLPRGEWVRAAMADHRYMSADAVWLVIKEAERIENSQPRRAVPLYDFATFLADATVGVGHGEIAEVRVAAWKDYAWILGRVGDYAAAEHALDMGMLALEDCSPEAARKLRPRLRLTLAIIYSLLQRWSEALAIVDEVARDATRLPNADLYCKAVEQRANILISTGRADEAADALMPIVMMASDPMTRARRHGNLARAFERRNDLESARVYLDEANRLYGAAGAVWEQLKCVWTEANIRARGGDIDGSLVCFERSAEGLRTLGDADTAIRVDLDRTEVELAHGLADEATYKRIAAAASYAIEKQLPVAKFQALEYLRSFGRMLHIEEVRYVRDFFDGFQERPHAPFSPRCSDHDALG